MADNSTAVPSWVYIWINGKVPCTEKDALDFRSCSLKLTVARWDAVTVYRTGIQNISLDQKICLNPKHIFGPKAESQEMIERKLYSLYHALWSLWFDLYCWSTAVLLLFFFSPLSGFPDIFSSFSTFHPMGLVLSFLFSDYFFPPSSSDHFIVKLSCIFLSFLSLLPKPALPSRLPLGQCCCCCCLISILRFTGAGLGCTDLVQHGHSAFVRRIETGYNNVWHSQAW